MVDDELAGELQHIEGIYEKFDATMLQSNLNKHPELLRRNLKLMNM